MMMDVDAVMPRLPPGGLFEIVFSFDTTGSMSRVIDEVKGRLQDMIQRLQADIAGIRIGVIVHGDYCDKDVFYLEEHVDLTTNVAQLCDFVKNVEGTGGGDPEECYEYVLNLVTSFSWTPGSQRALVVIGDATPHEPEYELNVDNLDWRKETATLAGMGVKLYGVQVFENEDSSAFFEELVTLGGGQHLKMAEFSHICDFIMAICYRERGEEFLHDYEAEVRAREARKKLHGDYENMFGVLKRGDSNASGTSAPQRTASITSKTGSLLRSSSSASRTGTLRTMSSNTSMGSASVLPDHPSPISDIPDRLSPTNSPSRSPSPISSCPPSPVYSSTSSSSSSASLIPNVKPAKATRKKTKSTGKQNPEKGTSEKANTGKRSVKTLTKAKVSRDKVLEKDFILNKNNLNTRWSKWKLAITNEKPSSEKLWAFRGRYAGRKTGWRRKELFPAESRKMRARLYEFAVQTKRGHKRRVVYSKWSAGRIIAGKWERVLLRRVSNVVEKLVNENCKIFVRRFVASKLGKNQRELVKSYKRMYTYAWSN